jgi:hypothetical protein
MASKGSKKPPKTNLKLKIFSSSNIFSSHFQGKQKLNINPSNHMEPFDIKTNCFDGKKSSSMIAFFL